MLLHTIFQKALVDLLLTRWQYSKFVLLIAMLAGGSAWTSPYEFKSSSTPYNVTGFTTVNNATIPTLISGFTVKSNARVHWDFDGIGISIRGPIVIEAGGTLKITAYGQLESSGKVTVNGTLTIANSVIDSTGLSNDNGTIIIGAGGTLEIANSKGSLGLLNYKGTVTIDAGGALTIKNSTQSMGLYNNCIVMTKGTLTIANSGSRSIGLFNPEDMTTVKARIIHPTINSNGPSLTKWGVLIVETGGTLTIKNSNDAIDFINKGLVVVDKGGTLTTANLWSINTSNSGILQQYD